jgi:hypothetical protein
MRSRSMRMRRGKAYKRVSGEGAINCATSAERLGRRLAGIAGGYELSYRPPLGHLQAASPWEFPHCLSLCRGENAHRA